MENLGRKSFGVIPKSKQDFKKKAGRLSIVILSVWYLSITI